jgi:protein-L-isoaspartate(D-aspartate) O-methyltransferase
MNLEQARFNMIEQQIRPAAVLAPGVLDLLRIVKREDFVPAAYRRLAFADVEIPLGHGARMFAPRIEAHALQALALKRHEKILEIGAGSGYMAALLGAHADHVWSVEIDPQLVTMARENLCRAGVTNVSVETGDGLGGLPAHAPYDVIMVSGAVSEVPPVLLDQLKPGGHLFAVTGTEPAMTAVLISRDGDVFCTTRLFETVVDPLHDTAASASAFVF